MLEQRRDFNVALSKYCNRLPCGEPGRCRQNLADYILDHLDSEHVAQARELLSLQGNYVSLTAQG